MSMAAHYNFCYLACPYGSRPLRALAHRVPAHRGRPHRAVQLALGAEEQGRVRAPHRGHRPVAQHAAERTGDHRRPQVARPRLGRGPGRGRPARALLPDAAAGHVRQARGVPDRAGQGVPLYNFGAVVDDVEMEITLVARGDDHVVNTTRQILMYQALKYPIPQFAHLPMILGADKQRLSKRHGAVSVLQYRDDGYLPGALVNYLARLGWSHGDQEIFTIQELIEDFDWEHVGANAGVFNPQKLEWVNQQWIKRTPPAEIAKAAGVSPEFAALMQERARNLNEIREAYRAYIVPDLPAYDEKAVAKQLTKETRPLLEEARTAIDRTFEQGPQAMEHAFRALAEQRGLGLGKLAQPVRVAVTGTTVSPPLFQTIALLGKARTLWRIDAALERIK